MDILNKSIQDKVNQLSNDEIIDIFGNLIENGIDPYDAFKELQDLFGIKELEKILDDN